MVGIFVFIFYERDLWRVVMSLCRKIGSPLGNIFLCSLLDNYGQDCGDFFGKVFEKNFGKKVAKIFGHATEKIYLCITNKKQNV